MTSLALLLGVVYAGWCALVYVFQGRVLFPRDSIPRPDASASKRPGVEQIWITGADGVRVEAWFIRAANRSATNPGPAVIYMHGNGELIDYWPDALHQYVQLGVSLLLVEYRGYGRSRGTPSEVAIIADMERFYETLATRKDVDAARIVLHGRSLGGAVAAALAARRQPAALILESTFTSVASFFSRLLVPQWFCTNPFRTDEVVASLARPILIFHGSRDDVVPVGHGRRLHELAPGSRYIEMPAGHNDFPPSPHAYWEAIRSFLATHAILAP